MKYSISITEVNYGSIIVEADSLEEAQDLAMDSYYSGEIHWTDSEITDVCIEETD